MSNPVTTSKYKYGWRLLLIKVIGAIAVVFLIETILTLIANNDPELSPFHNHYFSFSRYYLARQGLGSPFSDNPFATTRFVIYTILGYLIYAAINILWLIPALKRMGTRINPFLFYLMLTGAFLWAFFFPDRITVIDAGKKEIKIVNHSFLFIPQAIHIPFNKVKTAGYYITADYDGYNKQYINYLVVCLKKRMGL